MKTSLIIVTMALGTAYIDYRTIQGYRTGVLRLRHTFDRRTQPRMFRLVLILVTILSLLCLVALAMAIYGETHPGWRHSRGHLTDAQIRSELAPRTS